MGFGRIIVWLLRHLKFIFQDYSLDALVIIIIIIIIIIVIMDIEPECMVNIVKKSYEFV